MQTDPKRLLAESNGDSGLSDASAVFRLRAHALHGDNSDEARQETARDSLQVHEMEVSSVDVHTVGKRTPDPSEPGCEILEYQNSEKSFT